MSGCILEGIGPSIQGQCSGQEGGHFTAGHQVIWTEPIVVRRVAAPRDIAGGQGCDFLFEQVPARVDEHLGTDGQVQRPDEERRHLASGHRMLWTEPVVVRRVAAAGYVVGCQPMRFVLEDVALGDIAGPNRRALLLPLRGRSHGVPGPSSSSTVRRTGMAICEAPVSLVRRRIEASYAPGWRPLESTVTSRTVDPESEGSFTPDAPTLSHGTSIVPPAHCSGRSS